MKRFFQNNRDVAAFADEVLMNSEAVLPLTMIITRDSSGGFFAHTVTAELSADIAIRLVRDYYELRQRILKSHLKDG